MHSASADTRRALAALTVAVLLAPSVAPLPAAAQDAASTVQSPAAVASEASAITGTVARLKADPRLSGVHKTHTLRWKDDNKVVEDKPDAAWLQWISDLVSFLNDTSRVLFYGLVAVVAAVLLVSLRNVVQLRSFRRAKAAAAVSHVRDLDVRPESLPDDIGAAAWAMWRAGQVQPALSLLYRGALSRLIHKFDVPISAATTEGECVDLARAHLEPTPLRYVTQVVRAWEASIYGGQALSDAMGETLCTGFAARLDAAPTAPAASAGNAR